MLQRQNVVLFVCSGQIRFALKTKVVLLGCPGKTCLKEKTYPFGCSYQTCFKEKIKCSLVLLFWLNMLQKQNCSIVLLLWLVKYASKTKCRLAWMLWLKMLKKKNNVIWLLLPNMLQGKTVVLFCCFGQICFKDTL